MVARKATVGRRGGLAMSGQALLKGSVGRGLTGLGVFTGLDTEVERSLTGLTAHLIAVWGCAVFLHAALEAPAGFALTVLWIVAALHALFELAPGLVFAVVRTGQGMLAAGLDALLEVGLSLVLAQIGILTAGSACLAHLVALAVALSLTVSGPADLFAATLDHLAAHLVAPLGIATLLDALVSRAVGSMLTLALAVVRAWTAHLGRAELKDSGAVLSALVALAATLGSVVGRLLAVGLAVGRRRAAAGVQALAELLMVRVIALSARARILDTRCASRVCSSHALRWAIGRQRRVAPMLSAHSGCVLTEQRARLRLAPDGHAVLCDRRGLVVAER